MKIKELIKIRKGRFFELIVNEKELQAIYDLTDTEPDINCDDWNKIGDLLEANNDLVRIQQTKGEEKMRCKHMHKDAPENAICEDCAHTKEAHEDLKKTKRHLENLKLMEICEEFK